MRALTCCLLLLGLGAPVAAQQSYTLFFDGQGDEAGLTGSGGTDFSLYGSSWSGGASLTFGILKLYASGAYSHVPQGGPAQVRFTTELVDSATFFYVHNAPGQTGDTEGTARAYDIDDNEIASAASVLATAFNDPANFVTLDAVTDIARIEFDGGIIDSFSFTTSGVAAPPPLTDIVLGDRVRGTLAPGSLHQFPFEAAADGTINIRVTRKGKSDLQPGLRLIGPGDVELLATEVNVLSPKASAIMQFVVPQTGSYQAEVVDLGTTGGDYAMKTRLRPVKRAPQVVTVPPIAAEAAQPIAAEAAQPIAAEAAQPIAAEAAQPIAAEAAQPVLVGATSGTEIKRLVFKRLPAKGEYVEVEGQPNDLFPTIESVLPPVVEGGLDLTDLVTTSKNGRKVILKGLLLPTLGDYSLIFGGAEGSVGYGRLTMKLRSPKGKTVHDVP